MSFARNELYRRYPFKANDLQLGFGHEDWHWSALTLAAGIPHKPVPGTMHFKRARGGSQMSRVDASAASAGLSSPATGARSPDRARPASRRCRCRRPRVRRSPCASTDCRPPGGCSAGSIESSANCCGSKAPWRAELEDYPKPFQEIWAAVKPFTMTSPERGFALWSAVNHVVDCEPARSLRRMRRVAGRILDAHGPDAAAARGAPRSIFLFDTFAGMTEPGERGRRHARPSRDVAHGGRARRGAVGTGQGRGPSRTGA
jgi:hypothetical protein